MKSFKTLLVLAAILSSTFLFAQGDKSILRKKNGEEIPCDKIEKIEDGSITYKDGAVSRRVKLSDLSYAFAPKKGCSMILDADKLFAAGNYTDALKSYESAYDRYNKVGWDLYTIRRQAECLNAQKQDGMIIEKLKSFPTEKLNETTQWKQGDLDQGMSLLVTAMASVKDPKTATIATQILQGNYPNAIGSAHNAEGALAYHNGDTKGAFYHYAKTALLYKKSNAREEALCKAANIMKELKDSRSEKFSSILKTDHPQSPWIKLLK